MFGVAGRVSRPCRAILMRLDFAQARCFLKVMDSNKRVFPESEQLVAWFLDLLLLKEGSCVLFVQKFLNFACLKWTSF